MSALLRLSLAAIFLALCSPPAKAAEEVLVKLTIKDHRFTPDRLEIPARTKVILLVRNEDAEAEEFECVPLRREKIVFPGTEIRVVLGKVEPGEYPFVGEYHEATAKGVIIAR
ncbi:putative exported protein [Paramagnetospirillum magnetotacticum MS-1]|uniref:Putative exported protein n=1 Tax=Paramagnetospirillum magnetotacticum MS-1 TaxID=272627 RepID=A0A0C2YTG5_PARME|nr:cupredoxin domain-containing protein [Paramagnetospirillum magnetotacticum]KIL97990.1 putative exported protein [Paramagnetospirillum magnetotacticum MS-1]